jgi:hypothetical protein
VKSGEKAQSKPQSEQGSRIAASEPQMRGMMQGMMGMMQGMQGMMGMMGMMHQQAQAGDRQPARQTMQDCPMMPQSSGATSERPQSSGATTDETTMRAMMQMMQGMMQMMQSQLQSQGQRGLQ